MLSVAIVSYNAREALESCLRSLLRSTQPELEVLITDNASTDGTLEMLAKGFPEVDVLSSKDNVGFSRASNLCWRRARGDLVLFLNSDTLVPEGALQTLVGIMNERPDVGAVGPLLRNADGSIQMSFGDMLSFSAELWQKIMNFGYRQGAGPLRGYVERRHGRERTVDWVSGACLLTRRHLLEKTGGFDEAFFLYSEDVDLCARIRAEGANVLFTPEVEITHLRGRSAAAVPEKAFIESQRSRLHFYAKHYGEPRLFLLKIYIALRLGLLYLFRRSKRGTYREVFELVFGATT